VGKDWRKNEHEGWLFESHKREERTMVFWSEVVMQCPKCECEQTHIDSVRLDSTGGASARLIASGEDEYGAVEVERGTHERTVGRRHVIVLEGTCENGCSFEIAYRQHKGETQITQA
jgi:predicted nucleic-acid-binding Zn-ribbon protein